MSFLRFSIFLALLAGCVSTPSIEGPAVKATAIEGDDQPIDSSLMLAQRRALDRIYSQEGESQGDKIQPAKKIKKPVAPSAEHVYVMKTKNDHPKVQKWIKYYSVKDRKRFQRFLNRGARYKQVIQDLLVTNGLPPDLYYLGILESGYVTKAVSHAGAVGPWQFMAPTGRQYGLKINHYVDERVDPIRSTLAAIRYLKELYRQKKSWHMALAAYNAGPGRVRRAIRRGSSRNYWNLTRRRLLPRDTREYIPQFLAILTVGKNLDHYGFYEKPKDPLKPMELVKVPAAVSLKKIAQVTSVDLTRLKKLNPQIRRGVTPPTKDKTYHLWIDKKHSSMVAAHFDNLSKYVQKGLKVRRYIAGARVHRVRRGQNLSGIARRYGTTVSKIKRLNRLRSNRIYIGQRLRVKGRRSAGRVAGRTHIVRQGQTLSAIARRYSMSIGKLKRLNNMRSNRIYIGQKLKVRSVAIKGHSYSRSTYQVRRGDNLTTISKKTGVAVSKIKKINGMKNGKIYPGQKLRLLASTSQSSEKMKRYRIRRGDNLYKIAKKFGTTISRLKRINKLRSNRIMRGQVLLIAAN